MRFIIYVFINKYNIIFFIWKYYLEVIKQLVHDIDIHTFFIALIRKIINILFLILINPNEFLKIKKIFLIC